LGWLYGRAKRFDEALKVFEAVPRDVPDPLTHDYAIALSRFELSQYQGVIDTLKPDQAAGKADEKMVNLLAVAYSKLSRYREAYDVLSQQAKLDSSEVTTYLNLVTVCAEGGNLARATEVAMEARRRFPDSAEVAIVLGAADTMRGQLNQAFEEFTTAVRLAPMRADARFFLALVDYKQGKFSEAINILQTAIKDGVIDSDLHYLMAECLLKMDAANSDGALQELGRALDLDPNSISARTLRGKLLINSGRPREALMDLQFAHTRDPDSRAAVYNLARAYQAVGRRSDAELLFKELRSESADPLNEFSDTRLNEALTGKAGQQQ
jgi:tetratricopeptide (TPR) repeat protein